MVHKHTLTAEITFMRKVKRVKLFRSGQVGNLTRMSSATSEELVSSEQSGMRVGGVRIFLEMEKESRIK